jgi:hypothetical protein
MSLGDAGENGVEDSSPTRGLLSNSNVLSSAVVTSLIAAGRFGRVA